jgi:hypothetical protein
LALNEADVLEGTLEVPIPMSTALLQAVEALQQFGDKLLWYLEVEVRGKVGQAHVGSLFPWKVGDEIGRVDVIEVDIQAPKDRLGKEVSDDGESGRWRECLLEVDAWPLRESLGDETRFVLEYRPV